MKILHTSDWHIGRYFENESLETDQRAFVAWLVEQIQMHHVDLLVVAGDIWDKAAPRPEAVRQLTDALDLLDEHNIDAIFISGNHDNAVRLSFRGQPQGRHGARIFADDENYPQPYLYEKNGEQLAILPVPFLDPQRFLAPLPDEDGNHRPRTHENVLADALFVGRERLKAFGPVPTMVIAHAYVGGSTISDSERRSVGSADIVSADLFTGFTYTALGHLHRPQEVNGDPTIAYSGTPLPYSFSEDAPKSVRLVEISSRGFEGVTLLPVPMGRRVKVLTDTMANLLSDPAYDAYLDHWISVKLTDEVTQEQPMERLRARYPYIASLGYANVRSGGVTGPVTGSISISRPENDEIIFNYLTDMQRRQPTESERELVLTTLASVTPEDQA